MSADRALSVQVQEHLILARAQAIRAAYLDFTPSWHPDWQALADALVMAELVEQPSEAQLRTLCMLLPDEVFSLAVTSGMSVPAVAERIYRFVESNLLSVRAAIVQVA